MTGFELGVIIVSCIVLGSSVGMVLGVISERAAWTMRALDKDGCGTGHFADGTIYYIVPEKVFCEKFTRRVQKENHDD